MKVSVKMYGETARSVSGIVEIDGKTTSLRDVEVWADATREDRKNALINRAFIEQGKERPKNV